MNEVAIIVPFRNNASHTFKFLDNLFRNTDRSRYTLYLVDDDSNLETNSLISKKYYLLYKNEFGYIRNKQRLGFGLSVYKAIRYILQKGIDHKYVCILHSDIILPDNWLDELVMAHRSNRIIGSTLSIASTDQNLLVYDDNEEVVHHKDMSIKTIFDISTSIYAKYKIRSVYPTPSMSDVCVLMDMKTAEFMSSDFEYIISSVDSVNITKLANDLDLKMYYVSRVFIWHYGHMTKAEEGVFNWQDHFNTQTISELIQA